MKKIIFVLIFIVLLVSGFYLYNEQKIPFIDYEKEDVEISYDPVSEENDYYMINVEKISGEVLGAETVNGFIEEYTSDFKEMAEDDLADVEEDLMTGKYSLDMKIEDYKTDQYISYVLRIGEYTGGANMNQTTDSFLFDRNNKEELTLADVVDEDSFMEELRSKLLTGEEEGNFFPNISEEIGFKDVESFYITQEEVVVLFSKYKVAPGVAGIVEINIDR
ncbi:MAG: DUF3298 domain-containing protein [Patescibacteria group bacterium]